MNIFGAMWDFIQRLLMNRPPQFDVADDGCVACGSVDLTELAAQVYRCNMCGYEGGAGYAEYKQDLQHAGYDQMSSEQRHRLAVEKLAEALKLIVSSMGYLEGAQDATARDVQRDKRRYDQDKHDDLHSAFRLLTEAEELIDDAAYLLDKTFATRPRLTDELDLTMSSMNVVIDAHPLNSGLSHRVRELLNQTEQLEQWCRTTVAHVSATEADTTAV